MKSKRRAKPRAVIVFAVFDRGKFVSAAPNMNEAQVDMAFAGPQAKIIPCRIVPLPKGGRKHGK